jgi:hypothetical protein
MAADGRFSIEDSARRWHALAERRLAAYIELYRSGRWRHYYRSREDFAARMLDVIKVVKAFQTLADAAPSRAAEALKEDVFRTAA